MSQGPGLADLPDWPPYDTAGADLTDAAKPFRAWAEAHPDRFERRRLRVYVAGPISKGDVLQNVVDGIKAGRTLLAMGMAPYIPHLDAYALGTCYPDTNTEKLTWEAALEWDLEWVAQSEAVYRLPGESKGADKECSVATQLGLPVFYDLVSLGRWAKDHRKVPA